MRSLLAAAVILAVGAGACSAQATRFAFIVGNGEYVRAGDTRSAVDSKLNLVTPVEDALRYREVLSTRLGWTLLNRDPKAPEEISPANGFNMGVNDFNSALDAAGRAVTEGSEVLFIYNGHGFTFGDNNYLVGTVPGARVYQTVEEMQEGSIRLASVLERLGQNRPARIVLIVNACSDEPPVKSASAAPVMQDFSQFDGELLVLYSSSPKGVAYDVRETLEHDVLGGVTSVFGREFLARIEEDRPLLEIFTDVRIAVEKLSRLPAGGAQADRDRLQIPHVLYDSINGSFTIANGARALAAEAAFGNWRTSPSLCVTDADQLSEALAYRDAAGLDASTDGLAARACILDAARDRLGIETASELPGGAIKVLTANQRGVFRKGDEIDKIDVFSPDGIARTLENAGVEAFYEIIAETYFRKGWSMAIQRDRETGDRSGKRLENIFFRGNRDAHCPVCLSLAAGLRRLGRRHRRGQGGCARAFR